ncbi:N-acetyltransferase family protein [Ginsengibacter hankyongi]|uniref:N-acetyltransferase family protein n=1 Tax=Ginsengibacter hankyongi TaxID=2607284 RepID=A0A5J5ICJ0_9BACT|nr:GNAT family N-acetyltransferase [Ginsengibacter hankyongi]KAA9037175.1 N-acetyltransferase family protein [Ginsengibacter hankyongi]
MAPVNKNEIDLTNNPVIRLITATDIGQVLELYKPFVTLTTITPEYQVPHLEDFSREIKNTADYYPVLVCEVNNIVIGYTLAKRYRLAAGHQWSAETSIYVESRHQGRGVAKALYQALFNILKLQGIVNVFAGLVLPNTRSEVFHKNLGFQEVGIFYEGIYKLGNWHDVKWLQLSLNEHSKNPLPPKSIREVIETPMFKTILGQANNFR